MRTLLLLRGAMGSGKSTFIKENGLEPYTLEADRFRTLICNPQLNEEGYKYSLVFNRTSISMLTGGGEVKFIIRINQAINVWFEICNKQTELRQLILSKRESEMKLKEHYNYGRLLTLFQEDME